jgi:8-oxo-dGTP diphosphatase
MRFRICAGVIIQKDNKYLFGRKKKDIGPYPNTWMLIGGGIRLESETIDQGIIREIKEETNIKITNLNKLNFDEDNESDKNKEITHYVFLVYTADYKSGKPTPGDDIVELKWISKKDFKKYTFCRPTIKLFKQLKWL